jgi:hypothetical protein
MRRLSFFSPKSLMKLKTFEKTPRLGAAQGEAPGKRISKQHAARQVIAEAEKNVLSLFLLFEIVRVPL